jgi:hypothetical protein
VDPSGLAELVTVLGTWLGGRRVDLDEFLVAAGAEDPDAHQHLLQHPHAACC